MVHDGATRGQSARAETRIDALLVATSFVASAIGAYHALRSAGWRDASKSGNARANCLAVRRTTMTVRAAWGRITRLDVDDHIYLNN